MTNTGRGSIVNEVTCQLPQVLINKLYDVLVDALGNSEELLATHNLNYGRTTKKNEMTAKMYEEEIESALSVMKELKPLIAKLDNQ